MTDLLQMISEAIQRDVDHLTVLPDSQSIYLELAGRRWSLTLKDITDGIADLDTRIGPPRRKEMSK